MNSELMRKLLCEFLATFIFSFVGAASLSSQFAYSTGGDGKSAIMMSVIAITLVSLWYSTSGAQMNPIVSLSMMAYGTLGPVDGVFYILAQMVGGFLGVLSAVKLMGYDLDRNNVESSYVEQNTWASVIQEGVFAFFLVLAYLSCENQDSTALSAALTIGLCYGLLRMLGYSNTGGTTNIATKVGASLVTKNYKQLLTYVMAPFLGAIAAVVVMYILNPSYSYVFNFFNKEVKEVASAVFGEGEGEQVFTSSY